MTHTKFFTAYLTIILFSISSIALGQNTPKEIVSKFFKKNQNNGASQALDSLYSNNKCMKRATDAVTKLKQQLVSLDEDFVGEYYGYELIVEKNYRTVSFS